MKRKELEKLPVLRATTAMLEQAEKELMVQTGYFRKELRYEPSATPDASALIGF